MPAGPPAEVRPLGELGPGRVALAVLGDVRRARADGVQAADDTTVLADDLAVDRGPHTAEGEPGVQRLAEGQVVGAPRPLVLWLDPVRLLVEVRILLVPRMLVVRRQRRLEPTGRDAERLLHLRDRLTT